MLIDMIALRYACRGYLWDRRRQHLKNAAQFGTIFRYYFELEIMSGGGEILASLQKPSVIVQEKDKWKIEEVQHNSARKISSLDLNSVAGKGEGGR